MAKPGRIRFEPWACPEGSGPIQWQAANAFSKEGEPIEGIQFTMVGQHEDAIRTVTFTGPNSVASAGDEGVLNVWNPCESQPFLSYTFPDQVEALTLIPGGGLVAGDWSGQVVLWDQLSASPRIIVKRGPGTKTLAVSPNGTLVAQGGFSKSVRMLDVRSGNTTQMIARGPDLIYSVAWSHDGKMLAVGTKGGQVFLFDILPRGAVLREMQSVGQRIPFALAFEVNDAELIVGLGDASANDGAGGDTVAIWKLQQKNSLRELRGHRDYVYSVAVSSAGLVASGSLDRTVRIWDLQTGDLVAVLEDAEERVHSVAFSEDGRFLVAGSGRGKIGGSPGPDNSVRLYWLETLRRTSHP